MLGVRKKCFGLSGCTKKDLEMHEFLPNIYISFALSEKFFIKAHN